MLMTIYAAGHNISISFSCLFLPVFDKTNRAGNMMPKVSGEVPSEGLSSIYSTCRWTAVCSAYWPIFLPSALPVAKCIFQPHKLLHMSRHTSREGHSKALKSLLWDGLYLSVVQAGARQQCLGFQQRCTSDHLIGSTHRGHCSTVSIALRGASLNPPQHLTCSFVNVHHGALAAAGQFVPAV